MSVVRVGVAGVGSMGLNHCRILQMMRDCQFVGVYDVNKDRCQQVAKKYNLTPFFSFSEMLNRVDAVIISTPTISHFTLTEQAILQHKHVLVEKPLVNSLEEAYKIREMMKKNDVVVQVGHIERFNPAVQQLSKVLVTKNMVSLDARRLGVPNRNIDIDVILDLMIHDIDIILDIVNSPISGISAVGVALQEHGQLDVAAALLSFENGIIANLVANRISQEKIRSLYITEKDRLIKTNYLTRELLIYQKVISNSLEGSTYRQESLIEKILVPNVEPLFLEIEDFLSCIRLHQYPKIGVNEAIKALEVAFKIKELSIQRK